MTQSLRPEKKDGVGTCASFELLPIHGRKPEVTVSSCGRRLDSTAFGVEEHGANELFTLGHKSCFARDNNADTFFCFYVLTLTLLLACGRQTRCLFPWLDQQLPSPK